MARTQVNHTQPKGGVEKCEIFSLSGDKDDKQDLGFSVKLQIW